VCDAAKFSPIPPTEHPAMVEQARSLIARIEGRRASGGQPVPETTAQ
jgi:hypothetical protein